MNNLLHACLTVCQSNNMLFERSKKQFIVMSFFGQLKMAPTSIPNKRSLLLCLAFVSSGMVVSSFISLSPSCHVRPKLPMQRIRDTSYQRDGAMMRWQLEKSSSSSQRGEDREREGRYRGSGLLEQETHGQPDSSDRNSLFRNNYKEEWGVSRHDNVDEFPTNAKQVVEEAFEAIAGTIYNKNKLSPSIAQNAMSKSFMTKRPVRKEVDVGRIGVEIDGAEVLFPKEQTTISSAQATRRVSLHLAAKLSLNESWNQFESSVNNKRESGTDNKKSDQPPLRPVLVYCNTIKQALSASQDLARLKQAELIRIGSSSSKTKQQHQTWTKYDQIRIQSISDGLPPDMIYSKKQRRTHGGLAAGKVDATRGIVLFIQPTDYNAEYLPPGPSVGAVNDFQKIVAHTAIEELPTVVVSPRFMEAQSSHSSSGWDQSGYQQSATYGGKEPPKGPTPWVMRDFTPPAYCWVGNALALGGRFPSNDGDTDDDTLQCQVTRVALTQSVMDEDHPWHLFAAHECCSTKSGGSGRGRGRLGDSAVSRTIDYIYLASTKSAHGRPTRELIVKILESI